jgi:O-antigen/teichoic acid export membrane protein
MAELKTLLRHSSQYLTGRVAGMAIGLISFPILTRAFSVADYGLLTLVVKVAALATVLSKMGLQNSLQRFYPEYATSPDRNVVTRFYSTFLVGAAMIAGAVMIAFVAGLYGLPATILSPGMRKVLVLGSGLIFVRGMQSIVMGFLRAEQRTKAFNVLDVASKAATLALICLVLLAWKLNVQNVLLATLGIEAAAIAVVVLLLLRRGVVKLGSFDRKLFWAALLFGFPMIGYEAAGFILDSGDRILLQHYLGLQAVGYYSAGYNMANYIAESLVYSVSLALFPIYMRLWVTEGPAQTQRFLNDALDKFILVAMCILAGVAATARDAVVILGSQKLKAAYPLLPVLMIGLMIYAVHMFLNIGLVLYKKTYTMAKLIILAAVLNIVLNVILIPRIGMQGAAIATLVSYAVFVVLLGRASFALLPLRFNVPGCLRYALSALVSAFVATRIECSSALLSLALRGGICLVVYVALLWLMDRSFRTLIADAVRPVVTAPAKSGPASSMEIRSVMEAESGS